MLYCVTTESSSAGHCFVFAFGPERTVHGGSSPPCDVVEPADTAVHQVMGRIDHSPDNWRIHLPTYRYDMIDPAPVLQREAACGTIALLQARAVSFKETDARTAGRASVLVHSGQH
jgi:hypothetical protein